MSSGPPVTREPKLPAPTPPASPFPTPMPAKVYRPKFTIPAKPYIDSVAGIPIFDSRALYSPNKMTMDEAMVKQIVLVDAEEMDKVVSFDDPPTAESIEKNQYKGVRAFVTNGSFLPFAVISGKRYYVVNQVLANAVGMSSGGLTVPMNTYGDMFTPKEYNAWGKEKMIGSGNHDFLIVFAFMAVALLLFSCIGKKN